MIWAQRFSLAEWDLVSSEHSFVLALSLHASCFLKASQAQKTSFVPGRFHMSEIIDEKSQSLEKRVCMCVFYGEQNEGNEKKKP